MARHTSMPPHHRISPLMRRAMQLLGLACAAVLSAGSAAAQGDGIVGFRSPSNNIHCMYMPAWSGPPATPATLRCDIRQIDTPPPPRPRSCDLDWGRAFEVTLSGPVAEMICAGDTVYNDAHPVLNYGVVWQHGGFTCTSEADGVTCFNARRAGFRLSRRSREVF